MPNVRDRNEEYGQVYLRTGRTQATTTSSAVLVINTLFSKRVLFAWAQDEPLQGRQTDFSIGNSTGTFNLYQMLTPGSGVNTPAGMLGPQARFRVRQFTSATFTVNAASTRPKSVLTFATSVTVQVRWSAIGF